MGNFIENKPSEEAMSRFYSYLLNNILPKMDEEKKDEIYNESSLSETSQCRQSVV